MKRFVPIALVAVWFVACTPTKPNPFARLGIPMVQGEPDLSGVEITLNRTGSMLPSPIYALHLDGAGHVTYSGQSNVRTKGTKTARLDRAIVLALLDKFEEMDFMRSGHNCDYAVSDLPTPRVKLRVGATEQTFKELSGGMCRSDNDAHAHTHRQALGLMAAIDDACQVDQWIGSREERRENEEAYR